MAQRPPRVQVLGAMDEVERCQQHLAGQHTVRLEAVLPHPHQAVLAHGRHGLEHGGVRRPLFAAVEGVPPDGNRTGRDDDDRVTGGAGGGQLPAEPADRLGRDRGGADLHDGDHWSAPHVNVMAPTVTSSPSWAPARARARSTPRRRNRRTTSACAPSSLRSESATARSAARPWTTHSPCSCPVHGDALRGRPVHHDLARGSLRCLSPHLLDQRCQAFHQPPHARARGDREHHVTHAFLVGAHVTLAPHHDCRALQKLGSVRAELRQQDAPLLGGRHAAGLGRTEVEEDHQDPGALDVAQELVPQALALGRPLHQAGDVGHDELRPVAHAADPYDAEVRLEGREWIVGDFRLGRRHGRDQRRLAGVGESHQRHVGHELELHVQPELLALLGLLGEGGSSAAVREEACVPAAALATLGHPETSALDVEVADDGAAALTHDRADRDGHDQVLPPGPVLLGTRAVHAIGGAPEGVVPETEQRRLVHRRHEPHVPAVTAVTPIRAPAVHMGLSAPRHRPGSPITSARVQLGLVDEAGHEGPAYGARTDRRTSTRKPTSGCPLGHVELVARGALSVRHIVGAEGVLPDRVDGTSAEVGHPGRCGRRAAREGGAEARGDAQGDGVACRCSPCCRRRPQWTSAHGSTATAMSLRK